MPLDYIDYLRQLDTMQRSGSEDIPSPEMPAPPATSGVAGITDTRAYTTPVADVTPATGFEDTNTLGKIGLAIQGFGAGIQGQDPLFLKLRRQRMLEDTQKQEHELKLLQMKATHVEQSNAQFYKGVEVLKHDAKALNQFIIGEAGKGVPAAMVFRDVGVTTKDVDKILRPEYMPKLAVLAPDFHAEIVSALAGNTKQKIDANRARYYTDMIDKQDEAMVKSNAEANDFSTLGTKSSAGTLTGPEKERFNEYMAKQAERDAKYEANRIKYDAMQSARASGTSGAAELAAGVKTPASVTLEAQANVAGQPAQMRHRTVGEEGKVQFEQTDPKTGAWVKLGDPVKVAPGVSINLNQPKEMTPEHAARFSHFLEARDAARELPGLIFDENGKIKSRNLLTGAFPLGGVPFTEGRTLNQVVERGIQAKLRAETGAAAPENEVKNIALRYKPSLGDSPEQIRGKLTAFKNYIEDAIWLADPMGVHQARARGHKPSQSTDERGALLKKQHPDWTDYEVLSRLTAEGY